MLTGRHIMIDLETLGTSTSSIAMQVAACEFNPETGEVGGYFNRYVDIATSLRAGRTLDPDTILYWMGVEDAARHRMITGLRGTGLPLVQVLFELGDFMQISNGRQGLGRRMAKPDGVWSHGLTFDVPIIQEACGAVGMKEPFDFRDCLDTRTVFALSGKRLSQYDPVIAEKWPKDAPARVKHCGLSDAIAQAIAVSEALATIRGARA